MRYLAHHLSAPPGGRLQRLVSGEALVTGGVVIECYFTSYMHA